MQRRSALPGRYGLYEPTAFVYLDYVHASILLGEVVACEYGYLEEAREITKYVVSKGEGTAKVDYRGIEQISLSEFLLADLELGQTP